MKKRIKEEGRLTIQIQDSGIADETWLYIIIM